MAELESLSYEDRDGRQDARGIAPEHSSVPWIGAVKVLTSMSRLDIDACAVRIEATEVRLGPEQSWTQPLLHQRWTSTTTGTWPAWTPLSAEAEHLVAVGDLFELVQSDGAVHHCPPRRAGRAAGTRIVIRLSAYDWLRRRYDVPGRSGLSHKMARSGPGANNNTSYESHYLT